MSQRKNQKRCRNYASLLLRGFSSLQPRGLKSVCGIVLTVLHEANKLTRTGTEALLSFSVEFLPISSTCSHCLCTTTAVRSVSCGTFCDYSFAAVFRELQAVSPQQLRSSIPWPKQPHALYIRLAAIVPSHEQPQGIGGGGFSCCYWVTAAVTAQASSAAATYLRNYGSQVNPQCACVETAKPHTLRFSFGFGSSSPMVSSLSSSPRDDGGVAHASRDRARAGATRNH